MKRQTNILFLVLMLVAALFSSCSQPKSLVYQDVRNFRIHKVDLQRATIVLDLQFYNPNNYGLSLKNGDLDAYLNNRYLGKASLDERVSVPASDTFILPVSITADLTSIVTNAIDLLTSKNNDVLVRLQGNIRAGKGGVFIGVPVKYEGRQRISL
jgi:LEA14-like dessication related protein